MNCKSGLRQVNLTVGLHNRAMNLNVLVHAIVDDACSHEAQAQSLLSPFLPLQDEQWTFSEAQPKTARQSRALLAYPVKEDADLYLVLTHTKHENEWPNSRNYLLEIMADTPDNGSELLVVRRSGEGFEVIYRDPELQ